jgi:hypothetical protein
MAHHRHKMHHKAHGGGLHKGVEKAYGNEDVIKEANKTKGGFKRGGKVHGEKHKHHRLDKRARGGGTHHHPFSSAKTHEKGNLTYHGGTKLRPI